MGEIIRSNGIEVFSSVNEHKFIEIVSSSSSYSSGEDESPLRPIVCLKSIVDLKHFEETEDCFILDFDPYETVDLSNLSVSKNHAADGSPDVAILAEKGQVACRDYPHPRHLCLKFPFDTSPHGSFCNQCYCYVCDSAAPCEYWTSIPAHCDASEKNEEWKSERNLKKHIRVLSMNN